MPPASYSEDFLRSLGPGSLLYLPAYKEANRRCPHVHCGRDEKNPGPYGHSVIAMQFEDVNGENPRVAITSASEEQRKSWGTKTIPICVLTEEKCRLLRRIDQSSCKALHLTAWKVDKDSRVVICIYVVPLQTLERYRDCHPQQYKLTTEARQKLWALVKPCKSFKPPAPPFGCIRQEHASIVERECPEWFETDVEPHWIHNEETCKTYSLRQTRQALGRDCGPGEVANTSSVGVSSSSSILPGISYAKAVQTKAPTNPPSSSIQPAQDMDTLSNRSASPPHQAPEVRQAPSTNDVRNTSSSRRRSKKPEARKTAPLLEYLKVKQPQRRR